MVDVLCNIFAMILCMKSFVSGTNEIHFPLVRRERSDFSFLRQKSYIFSQKLHASFISSQIQYSTRILIGTPPREYDMVIDTGSSDLWIQGTGCKNCSTSSKRFSPNQSTTFHPGCRWHKDPCIFQIKYGSGESIGMVGRDVISIGEFDLADNLQFGITLSEDGQISRVLSSSGILGLGFENLATYTIPSVTSYLNSFALQLDNYGGMLSINGILPQYTSSHYSWATIDVEKYNGIYNYWTAGMPELIIGDSYLCGRSQSRCQVVFDSGTGFIAAPRKYWGKLKEAFAKHNCFSMINSGGLFRCKKKNIPPIDLMLGTFKGFRFNIPLEAYTISTNNPDEVIVGIVLSPIHVNIWIFGNVFLKEYYVQYNVQSKSIRLTRENALFQSIPIPLYEQPSYFDIIYSALAAEYIVMTCIIITSSLSIVYICQHSNKKKYEYSNLTTDDALLVNLLSDKGTNYKLSSRNSNTSDTV